MMPFRPRQLKKGCQRIYLVFYYYCSCAAASLVFVVVLGIIYYCRILTPSPFLPSSLHHRILITAFESTLPGSMPASSSYIVFFLCVLYIWWLWRIQRPFGQTFDCVELPSIDAKETIHQNWASQQTFFFLQFMWCKRDFFFIYRFYFPILLKMKPVRLQFNRVPASTS